MNKYLKEMYAMAKSDPVLGYCAVMMVWTALFLVFGIAAAITGAQP